MTTPASTSRDSAATELADQVRTWVGAGRSPAEVRLLALEHCALLPVESRPDHCEIDRMIAYLAAPPLTASSMPQSPGAADLASERYLAEQLAKSDLRQHLRFVASGTETGWRRWGGDSWEPCVEVVPVSLAAAVHCLVGKLLVTGMIERRTAIHMESTTSLRAIRTQLEGYDEIRIDAQEADPPEGLATVGGCLDLVGGCIRRSDPTTSTYLRQCGVGYDPDAEHPAWTQIARHVEAHTLGGVIQKYIGASLLGIPPDRKMLVLTGKGGDGKSTFLRTLHLALGGFATIIPQEGLAGGGRGAHGHELLHGLATARLGISLETPSSLDWPLIKAISGGDPRTSKRLHGRASTTTARCWLAIATNEMPMPPDAAAADRIILVVWNCPTDPDPEIVRILGQPGAERSMFLRAALRWAVQGCRAFLAEDRSLGIPDFARPEVEHLGLCGWWEMEIAAGSMRPGKGWTAFAILAGRAQQWCGARPGDMPTDTAIGVFLRSRLVARRQRIDGHNVTVYAVSIASDGADILGSAGK